MSLIRTNQPGNVPGGIPINAGPAVSFPPSGQVQTADGRGNAPWAPGSGGGGGGVPVQLGNIGAALTVNIDQQPSRALAVTSSQNGGTLNFTGFAAGDTWTIYHVQGAAGSLRTVFSGVTWLTGTGSVNGQAGAEDVFTFYSPDGLAILGFQQTAPVYGAPQPNQNTQFMETMPRQYAGAAKGFTSGAIWLSHFQPDRDITLSTIATALAGTAAAGATLTQMGIAQYNGGNSYTVLGATSPTGTGFWTAGYSAGGIAVDGSGNPASTVALKAGVGLVYAVAVLFTGTTGPQLAAAPVFNNTSVAGPAGGVPRITAITGTGKTAITGTITDAFNAISGVLWAALY